MAHHKSALKRMRQDRKRKIANRNNKKRIKEAIKSVYASETFEVGFENFKKANSLLDKLSLRGVIHKNTAANRKSSLAKHINKIKASTEVK